jgi:hypothetical protein
MNGPIKEAEDAARRILACEAVECDPSQAFAASRAIEKLRLYLTKFVGAAGFQALLVRAVAVAKTEAPWLGSVQVSADGRLAGFDEAARRQDGDVARHGEMALLAQLLALLVIFIGATITFHMAQDVWPDARVDNSDTNAGETMG